MAANTRDRLVKQFVARPSSYGAVDRDRNPLTTKTMTMRDLKKAAKRVSRRHA